MANLKLSHIYKVYPNGVKAVNDFTMDIEDKEFIVFVGPSGCGKSTTLRMIAGLEEITAGELRIGDVVVNDMEPKDRDIAMVFQNYALYPHMTVYDNMAFGLKLRKVPKAEIDKKVRAAAEILGITEYLDRKPRAMSGGQRQRVALGRAIVREPKVFLLDEPLSNLDAKLRTAMRSEISKLHHKLQTTFIYVTHDQVEAMTMGTRIVVMKDGFIQQIDTPRNLYRYPCNKFVAGFIGTPQMNFFNGSLQLHDNDKVLVKFDNTGIEIDAPYSFFTKADRKYLDGNKQITLGIRAEHISVDPNHYPFKAKCRVFHLEELGTECQVFADLNLDSEDTIGESPTRIIIKALAGTEFEVGEIIDISIDLSHLSVFDSETEKTIAPRIPEQIIVDGEIKEGKLEMLGDSIDLPQAITAENGEYDIVIPTAAISIGNTIDATIIKEENVNGQRLVHLQVADRVLFAIVDKDENIEKNATVKIDIDLKQITFEHGNDVVVEPLNLVNTLPAKFGKEKVVITKEVRGKMKKVRDLAFYFEIAGQKFDCPIDFAIRIINGSGMDIFKKELEVRFSPYQAIVGENGIAASVEKIIPYSTETFAVCKVGEKLINIVTDKNDLTEITFAPDINSAQIFDVERGIRLI